jgi:hypothetical protein
MGNNASTEDVAFSPGEGGPKEQRSPSVTRRIVKASFKPSTEDLADVATAEDNDDTMPRYLSPTSSKHVPKVSIDPSVERELEEEQQEESKQERIQTMEQRQRSKREKAMQQRRTEAKKEVVIQANLAVLVRLLGGTGTSRAQAGV